MASAPNGRPAASKARTKARARPSKTKAAKGRKRRLPVQLPLLVYFQTSFLDES